VRTSLLIGLGLAIAVASSQRADAQPAQLQDNGLHVQSLTSSTPGAFQVLVEADAPHDGDIGAKPDASNFTVWVNDGAATNLTITRNGDRGNPPATIVLLDESLSYKMGASKTVAEPALADYVGGVAAGDKLGLMVFAATATPYPVHTDASNFTRDLGHARKSRRGGQRTNLLTGLTNAIELVTKEADPGLREVILFTDAGDEAVITEKQWDEVYALALQKSVTVHVVVTPTKPRGIKPQMWLDALNKLEGLAKATHGVYDKSGTAAKVSGRLKAFRAVQQKWLFLEGGLCGLASKADSEIRVEYVDKGARKAWTGASKLSASAWSADSATACPDLCKPSCQGWEECIGGVCSALTCSATSKCPGGATCRNGRCEKPCAEACESWEQCVAGECTAKVCKADETCGAGAQCKDGACVPISVGFFQKYLLWILIAAALLLAIGAFLLLRKKPEPEVVPEPAPLPEPEPEPEAKVGGAPVLDDLPEMHLEAIAGWPTKGERWRLHKRKVYVGGSDDPADGNDYVFNVNRVSGKHAMFQLYPSGDLWVTDLKSTNGTFVNNRRLDKGERAKLSPGDQVKLSMSITLRVVKPGLEAEEPELAPEPGTEEAPEPEDDAPKKKQKKATKFDPGTRKN
jgi:hypothetical protein